MKKMRALLCLLLAFCVCAPYAQTKSVSAGKAGVQIEDGLAYGTTDKDTNEFTVSDDLMYASWKFTRKQGIALIEKGKVNFSKASDIGNPFISRTAIQVTKQVEDGLQVSFTLNIKEMVGDKRFGFVFGLPRLDKDVEETGSTYLYFVNDNGAYKYGVTYYGEEQTQVIAPTALPTGVTASNLAVSFVATATGKLRLNIGENAVFESADENQVNANGYLGFAQSGAFTDNANYIDIDISNLKILNEYYATPKNPEVSITNFDGGEFNTQEWYLNSTRCGGNGVIAGDGVLKFDGSGQNSYFATRHKYSNFELEYDFSNPRNYATTDASGWVTSASNWHGIEFGRDGNDVSACYSLGTMTTSYFLYFSAEMDSATGERVGKTTVRLVDHGAYKTAVTLPDKYGMFNADFDGAVRIKICVRDGVLNVYMRLTTEYEWTSVYHYEMANGYTPVGYIGFRGEGNQYVIGRTMTSGSFYEIDNIVITNYDLSPQFVEVGFTSNVLPKWEDYKYFDPWTDDYLIKNTKGKGTK